MKNEFAFANIQLDFFIIAMLLIFAIYLLSFKRYKQRLNRYLLYFIISNIMFMVCDLADWYYKIAAHPLKTYQIIILTSATIFYYIASGLIAVTFGLYFMTYVGVSRKTKERVFPILSLLGGTEVILSIASPFIGEAGIFYINGSGYHRGTLFGVNLVIPMLCGLTAVYIIVIYREKMSKKEIIFCSLFFVLPICGNIMQIMIRGMASVNIFLFISVFLIMINIQFEYELKLNRQRQETAEMELQQAKKYIQMANETILTIANAVDAKDIKTSRHSYRVAEYSVLIAEKLGFTKEKLEDLKKTALLHDIGKIGIPDSVLNKPARLTDEEYEIMQSHVEKGSEILKNFTLVENVAEGALYHHERYDGKGYMHKLKGKDIPLNARIIGVADAFDAMTSNRVYREKLDTTHVMNELKNGSGTQFDPQILDILLELIDDKSIDMQKIYETS